MARINLRLALRSDLPIWRRLEPVFAANDVLVIPLVVRLGQIDDPFGERDDGHDWQSDEARADRYQDRCRGRFRFAHHELVDAEPAEPEESEDDGDDPASGSL